MAGPFTARAPLPGSLARHAALLGAPQSGRAAPAAPASGGAAAWGRIMQLMGGVAGRAARQLAASGSRAHAPGTQSVTNSVVTKVTMDTQDFDLSEAFGGNEYDPTTNYRFTASVRELLEVKGYVRINAVTAGAVMEVKIRKNGADYSENRSWNFSGADQNIACEVVDEVILDPGEWVEIWVVHGSAAAKTVDATSFFTVSTIAYLPPLQLPTEGRLLALAGMRQSGSQAPRYAETPSLGRLLALSGASQSVPTEIKAAQAGSSGVPGDTNRYVTDSDPRNTNARTPTSHVLATGAALGAEHTISGAAAGEVLRALSATTAAFDQLQHADLGGVTPDQHHAQSHVLAGTGGLGADHTVSGLTAGQVLRASGATAAAFAALDYTDLAGTLPLHAATHKHGGTDEVATATAGGNLIPKAGASGKLDKGWLPIMIGSGASHAIGATPDTPSQAGTLKYLREDGTWAFAPTLTTVEISLGSAPNARRSGSFLISGITVILTTGKPVWIRQASGPYTGKGAREDEAEMDMVQVTAKVVTSSSFQCYWEAKHRVRGNFKFEYALSA